MTQISKDDIYRLANLSSLELSDAEADSLRGDLDSIMNYVKQLSELDTEGIEPTYQVTDLQNIWRQDVVDDYGVPSESLLSLAPELDKNQIKVPKVL